MRKRYHVKLNSWIPRICELILESKICGIDIETFPLNQFRKDPKGGLDPHRSQIRCIQISIKDFTWLIDLFYVTDISPLLLLFSDPSITWIIQNAVFETEHFLHKYNAFPDNVFDTMLASRLLQPAGVKGGNRIGEIAERYLNLSVDKSEQKSDWSEPELSESKLSYAFKDSELVYDLFEPLNERLELWSLQRCAKIEFDCVLSVAQMELNGIKHDQSVLNYISNTIQTRLDKLTDYFKKVFPSRNRTFFEDETINLDSNIQIADAFFRATGIKLDATDKDALLNHREKHTELVDALLDFSALSSRKSTFCDKIDKFINPITSKIHPSVKQIGQDQHRTAMENPNFNFPRPSTFGNQVSNPAFVENSYCDKNFREVFVPEEGNLFSVVDFKNNQLRLIADTPFANIKSLQEEFDLGPDAKPFEIIASRGLGCTKEEVTKEQRQSFKTLTYALSFGSGIRRFQQTMKVTTREIPSYEDCKKQIDLFYTAVPEMREWHVREPLRAKENGYTESILGRKIFGNAEYFSPNRAINFPITSTEVDGAKLALGRLSRFLLKEGYRSTPRLFIYDEILLSGPESEIPEVHEHQKKIMIDAMQEVFTNVKADVSGGVGTSWAEKD